MGCSIGSIETDPIERLEHCQSIEQFQELVQTVIKHTAAPAYAQARHALLEWVKHELWQRNVPHHPVGHIRKFGPLPQAYEQRLRIATTAELETWSLNFVDASTLAGVFFE